MPRPYWWVVGGAEYSEYSNTQSYPLIRSLLTAHPLILPSSA